MTENKGLRDECRGDTVIREGIDGSHNRSWRMKKQKVQKKLELCSVENF